MDDMTELEEYQEWVQQTLEDAGNKIYERGDGDLIDLWATSALAREASEVYDHFEKNLRKGRELDVDAVIDELGDVFWYLACVANRVDISLDDVMERNIQKINGRVYGSGQV